MELEPERTLPILGAAPSAHACGISRQERLRRRPNVGPRLQRESPDRAQKCRTPLGGHITRCGHSGKLKSRIIRIE